MTPPPGWTEKLLGWLLPPDAAEEIVGDLREEWGRRPAGAARMLRHGAAVVSIGAHFLVRAPMRLGWGYQVRLALRRLCHDATFSGVAVSAIGLGLGVNVLMLAIAETVLFAPLPYPDGERLAVLSNEHTGSSTGGFGVAYESIRDVEERTRTLESIALYMDWQDVSYEATDGAVQLPAAFVSQSYVESLGLSTSMGRFFTNEENGENAAASVAVIGRGTWTSVFGGSPDVLGRTLDLNGHPYEVVGVVDDDRGDLRYLWGQEAVGIYLPLFAVEPLVGFDLDATRGNRFLNGLVRLRPDASVESAQAELSAISSELASEFPRSNQGWSYRLQPLDEAMYEELRTPTTVVLGISALVFALVAVNLLTLVLLRASSRAGEAAVRRALGAGRARIVAQLLTESVLLAGTGWVLGMMLGAWGLELFQASDAIRLPEFASLAVDGRVLTVSGGGALLLALLLTAAPAVALLRTPRWHDAMALKGGRATPSRARTRIQGTLVAVEVALACVLLVGAGLLLQSFHTLRGTGYGFDTDRLLIAQVDARSEEMGTDELMAFASELVARVESLPGAGEAFIWSPNRLGHGNQVEILTREDRWAVAPEERLEASLHTLRPGTLERLGIRLLSGRDVVGADDASSQRVALVSESLGRALWPGLDPVGRTMETMDADTLVPIRVVGVVSDARHRTRLIEPFAAQRDVYYPYRQEPRALLSVVVRHAESADLSGLAAGIRSTVASLSPSSPVYGVTTMAEEMRREEGPARLGALLVSVYAVLAAALAALGLYGVLAHGVQIRLREIGIRKALGADRRTLLSGILRKGGMMAGAGLAVGLVLSVSAAGLIEGALYGEGEGRPWVFAGVLGLLSLVALFSSALPASRATRIPPSEVLRAD